MVCYAVPPLEVFHQVMEIHQRSREPSGLVGKSANQGGQPTYPWRPSGPSFLGALRHCWRGRGHQEDLFLKSFREVLLYRAEMIILAVFWCNVWDYLLVGHGR